MSVLFATSELYPFIKTGGLGDVSYALPRALQAMGETVAIIIPLYAAANLTQSPLKKVASFSLERWSVSVVESALPDAAVPVYWIDCPELYDRAGGPYGDTQGDYPDNHLRFYVFCKAVTYLLANPHVLGRSFDTIHCNDWQTGLIPLLIKYADLNVRSVFTIHNLAYGGIFGRESLSEMSLPDDVFHHDKIEFYGSISYLKAGLVFSDVITTVSPSYAEEIQTVELGYGFDGLLRHRQQDLMGILNGIDIDTWNPATDIHIAQHYNHESLPHKSLNKRALQSKVNFEALDVPVISLVGRLVEQKGIDMVVDAIPVMIELGCQIVILGQGQSEYESTLLALAKHYPQQLSVKIGYDEALAHLIEAGSDIFLMPSIFEPCGLNQLYSLTYGTLPVVTSVGGLKDTVIGYTGDNAAIANGFVLKTAESVELIETLIFATGVFKDKLLWQQLQLNAMNKDFSWALSATRYIDLYQRLQGQKNASFVS